MNKIKILIILLFMSIALTTRAHEIVNRGTVTLLIHVEPGHDTSIAGNPITINVDLKNSEKEFSLNKCNCKLTINQVVGDDEKEIFTTPILPAKALTGFNIEGIPFTFPKEGEYHLNIEAKPNTPNLFSPFEVEGHVNVLQAGSKLPTDMTTMSDMQDSADHAGSYFDFILIEALIIILLICYIIFIKRKVKN